ncbi:peptidase M14, carboxypeptidase A [Fibrisoma limi BUZ 3]|uniref:Peptidase M14, carboxypeptidase A n=1 Tax=Fibrisoma limi BUZ 3 TaxID=1185876 RepID=I2GFD8_9BACT|nr:M14 family metallopeptidase [Fibrisoma limi]CCH52613.1 peptidase M14, carboxypeptidase A [Fibrisoma limi BUZ 3]
MIRSIALFLCLLTVSASAQKIRYELSQGKETATYAEIIAFYQQLDRQYEEATLIEVGPTDAGKPLHLFLLDPDRQFTPTADKVTLLINNGIHPGEPEGIDATMLWVRDMLNRKTLPSNVLLAIVPVYNIGGCLNRGVSRVNQNGPLEYGFRGNARNYDLNRDFIKTDTEDARTWQTMFQTYKPHVLIDNHTSNGADYQHIMTYFATLKDKLHPAVSGYMAQTLQPELDKALTAKGFEPVPYVNNFSDTPESGFPAFNDSPRYSSGYAALFNCIGFVVELHMWKDYPSRVRGTLAFMEEALRIVSRDATLLIRNKQNADEAVSKQTEFPLTYKLDRTKSKLITFNGYEAKYKPSDVSSLKRLYYDRSAPFTKQIPYQNSYVPDVTVRKPKAYVIPQGWTAIIDRLKRNGAQLRPLSADSLMTVQAYYIEDAKTTQRPFEGHYVHSNVVVRKESLPIQFYKGDYVVSTDQPANRYVVETLEPQGIDSFFAWNFFDSILGQKEHFSAYIFEDTAAELLKNDPALRKKLEERRATDTAFANDANAQLEFVYRHSTYYEKTHNRYPVYRLER